MNWETTIQWLSGHPIVWRTLAVLGVLLLSYLTYVIVRRYLLRLLARLVQRSQTRLDDVLFEKVVARRLAYLAPLLVAYYFAYLIPGYETIIQQVLLALMVWVLLISLGAFLNVMVDILKRLPFLKDKPIRGYVQLIKLFVYIAGAIIIFGQITGTSVVGLLSGLGAMTAVLLLVFRDTILSLVASIQIAANDLIRVGDWIEVRKHGADGTVTDIALHTITIQNWDKTITVIPTYRILEDTFVNWRGMEESGGRRIKRAIYIDITSVRFCDEELIRRFRKIHLLTGYVDQKLEELRAYNEKHNIDDSVLVNGRRMTNVGTFRAYVEAYLQHHPHIRQDMTLLVRQLPPGPQGLPIEIYAFTRTTAWKTYEAIQADIFDHLLAVIPEFDLRVFQIPSGADLERLRLAPGIPSSPD